MADSKQHQLSLSDRKKVDLAWHLIDFIKKQIKVHRLHNEEAAEMFRSTFQRITSLAREVEFSYRWERTDLESTIDRLVFNRSKLHNTLRIQANRSTSTNLVESSIQAVSERTLEFTTKVLVGFATDQLHLTLKQSSDLLLDQDNLLELVKAIAHNYGISPLHNFTCRFHSMLMLRYFFDNGLNKHLNAFELFFCQLMLLSHCMLHEEVNNSFVVRARLPEAVEFCNQHVQQRMGLERFVKIISSNIKISPFAGLSNDKQERARKILSTAALATDIGYQQKLIYNYEKAARLKELAQLTPSPRPIPKDVLLLYIQLIIALAVHAAVNSHYQLTYDVYYKWEQLTLLEIFMQRQIEQEFKLEYKLSFRQHDPSRFAKERVSNFGSSIQHIWKLLNSLLNHSLEEDQESIQCNFFRTENSARSRSIKTIGNSSAVRLNNIHHLHARNIV